MRMKLMLLTVFIGILTIQRTAGDRTRIRAENGNNNSNENELVAGGVGEAEQQQPPEGQHHETTRNPTSSKATATAAAGTTTVAPPPPPPPILCYNKNTCTVSCIEETACSGVVISNVTGDCSTYLAASCLNVTIPSAIGSTWAYTVTQFPMQSLAVDSRVVVTTTGCSNVRPYLSSLNDSTNPSIGQGAYQSPVFDYYVPSGTEFYVSLANTNTPAAKTIQTCLFILPGTFPKCSDNSGRQSFGMGGLARQGSCSIVPLPESSYVNWAYVTDPVIPNSDIFEEEGQFVYDEAIRAAAGAVSLSAGIPYESTVDGTHDRFLLFFGSDSQTTFVFDISYQFDAPETPTRRLLKRRFLH